MDFDGNEIRGIGIAGQMHGLVILDKNDEVIRPVILWNEGRTHSETAYLNEVVGKDKLFEYSGNIAFAGFTAPKIMWLRKNEPENFEKISKVLLPKDYINYLFTGVHCTDYSDASGMLLLDVKIMMSAPVFFPDSSWERRKAVIKKTYTNAVNNGDKNVYFIDGKDLMQFAENDGTVDNCHPNDLGFYSMAKVLSNVLGEVLLKK